MALVRVWVVAVAMVGVCGGGRCGPKLEGGGVRVALVQVLGPALIRG